MTYFELSLDIFKTIDQKHALVKRNAASTVLSRFPSIWPIEVIFDPIWPIFQPGPDIINTRSDKVT